MKSKPTSAKITEASQTKSVPHPLPPGVVTTSAWTSGPDGHEYRKFWSARWHVVTNKASGIQDLHTTDRFAIVALRPDGHPAMIIPGCRFDGFSQCSVPPNPGTVYAPFNIDR
jgi:hypothetical protein